MGTKGHKYFVGHAAWRMETRFGIKKEAQKNRFAREAWNKGERYLSLDFKRKTMIAYLWARESMQGKIVKLYMGNVFVFSKNSHKLATCYPCDEETLKADEAERSGNV